MSKRTLIPLTGAQKNVLHELAENPVSTPAFAQTGPANPKLRVLTVHFDGTENDADHVDHEERPTLVAESHRAMLARRSSALESLYYQGVGTSKGPLTNKLDAMFGIGCRDNAEAAYVDLVRVASQWVKEDPEVEVHVHVVGFSRGSASAIHFMNLVDKLGVRGAMSRSMSPGCVKTSAVLFDTVSTGVNDLELSLPNSNIATLHITAGGEERKFFKLTPIDDNRRPSELALARNVHMEGNPPGADGWVRYQRLQTIEIPGARHSDIGGSYPEGGIRELSAYLARQFQRTLGLPVDCVRPSVEAIQGMHANDSRWVRLSHDLEDRQQAVRDEIEADRLPWDGSYSERVVTHGGNGQVLSDNVRIVRSTAKDWARGIDEHMLGNHYRLTWTTKKHPATGMPMVECAVSGAHSSDFKFDNETGALMLHGVAIQGAPTQSQVYDELRRNGAFTLYLGLERGMAPYDARQVPGHEMRARRRDAPMWPDDFLQTIKEVNASSGRTNKTMGQVHLYDCMSAAARWLQDQHPDIVGVRIAGPDVSESGTFELTCHRSNGRVFRQGSETSNEAEYLLSIQLRSLQTGLDCVMATITQEVGVAPNPGNCNFGNVRPTSVVAATPLLRPSLLGRTAPSPSPFASEEGATDEATAPRRLRLVK